MFTVLDRHKIREKENRDLEGKRNEYRMIGYVMCEPCKGTGIKSKLFKSIEECEHCDGEGGFKAEKSALEEMQDGVMALHDAPYQDGDKKDIYRESAIDLIVTIAEKHYGSGKAMQVADILRGE